MSAAPLIKTLNTTGGTMFVFPSANNQLNSIIGESNNKFTFSNYALLNIPNIKTPGNSDNSLQFATIDGQILEATNLNDNDISLVESIQNYCLNLETSIINEPDYQPSIDTVSERVFFKWLKELGGIRFQHANEFQSQTADVFVEENSPYYKRVVEYLGEVQVTNNNNAGGDNYREVYINVPTTHSSTPTVLFDSYQDANYSPSKVWTQSSEYIRGRTVESTHPNNLSLFAFYDVDDIINYSGANEDWFGANVLENSYYTQPDDFNSPENTEITKSLSDYGKVGTVTYLRSNLDGIQIDWNEDRYLELNSPGLTSIQESNEISAKSEFEFNCVLLYYTFENELGESTKNLYGVLFIDNLVHDTVAGSYINRFKKTKYNKILRTNGNSFSMKMNFKLGTNTLSDVHIENVINDYETYSLSLFTEALSELKKLASENGSVHETFTKLYTKYDDLTKKFSTKNELSLLTTEFNKLKTQYQNANLVISDLQSILDKLENMSIIVSTILNNRTPINLELDYSPLLNGNGVEFLPIGNKLKINSTVQSYNNVSQLALLSDTYEYTIKLSKFTNLLVINNEIDSVNNNITIRINDFPTSWETNQVLKVVFKDNIKLNGYSLKIATDSKNALLNSNVYMKNIYLTNNDILENNIEFICIDKFNKNFIKI